MACSIIRILTINTPITYGDVQVINQEQKDVTALCRYSTSTDGVCWTQWVDYHTYKYQASSIEGDYYLRLKLFGSFDRISINGLFTKCYSICLDNTNPFLTNFCQQDNLFNPYANLDCALLLQQQLSDGIICMLGIPVYYFRVMPKEESADFNFKEYVFHNIDSVKYIKMMLQDGELPSSKPSFDSLDFNWETDWEVELSKTQFANAFGDDAFPKQRDLVYVPMMKRMWEVNSAYDEKNEGLMWRSTTWKLALIKYAEKTNVDKGDFEDIIDALVVNKYEEVFAGLEENEQVRETATTQVAEPKFAANNLTRIFLQDAIRKEITRDNIDIKQVQLNHRNLIIGRNMYYGKGSETPIITYQNKFCYDSFTFSFILDINNRLGKTDNEIIKIGEFSIHLNQYDLYVEGREDEKLELEFGKKYIIWGIIDHETMGLVLNAAEQTVDAPAGAYLPAIPNEKKYFNFANAKSIFARYNDDWNCISNPKEVYISPNKVGLCNIKIFNKALSEETILKEIIKYTTNNESCIINDLARPLNDGLGYDVR